MILGHHHGRRPTPGPRNGSPRSMVGRKLHRENGETLIEVIMTVVLLGIAIVALLGTMVTLILSSNAHRRRVRAGNEATTIVEELQRVTYVPCATKTTAGYTAALTSAFKLGTGPGTTDKLKPNYVATIAEVDHLASATAATPTWVGACPGGVDQGVQQITVELRSPNQTEVVEKVTLVKRNATNDCITEPCA